MLALGEAGIADTSRLVESPRDGGFLDAHLPVSLSLVERDLSGQYEICLFFKREVRHHLHFDFLNIVESHWLALVERDELVLAVLLDEVGVELHVEVDLHRVKEHDWVAGGHLNDVV